MTTLQSDRETIIFKSTVSGAKVTLEDINHFKRSNSIKKEEEIPLQELGPSNRLMHKGSEYLVHKINNQVNVFSKGATYTHNGILREIPMSNIYEDENNEEIITVVKNSNQELQTLTIYNKFTQETSEINKLSSNVFATMEESFFDYNEINAKYFYGNHSNESNDKQLSSNLQTNKFTQTCSSYSILELAIAYDSSFCSYYGGSMNAETAVMSIVAAVSRRFMQNPLCIKVRISHLEGYCDPTIDPYKEFIDLNRSGCGNTGLLHYVRDYWSINRNYVHRDAMHLFSGTGLECRSEGCVLGCAFRGMLCQNTAAFGVNYITYTSSSTLQGVLVSHELGHNSGATHEPQLNYIMYSRITTAPFGFSTGSLADINDVLTSTSCITTETPSMSPSLSSLPSPYPTLEPSFVSSSFPTSLPSIVATSFPSSSPSISHLPSYTPTSSPSLSFSPSLSVMPSVSLCRFTNKLLSSFLKLL